MAWGGTHTHTLKDEVDQWEKGILPDRITIETNEIVSFLVLIQDEALYQVLLLLLDLLATKRRFSL